MKRLLFNVLFHIVFLCFFNCTNVIAQDGQDKLGNWLMYFGSNKLSNTISLHSEIQYRNHEVSPNTIEQLLLRTGVNYHINTNAFATMGYGYVAGHLYDTEQSHPESEEHRIWQQFILNSYVGRVKLEHRYRVEQRFVNDIYKNRLRYRLMFFVPLNKDKIESKTWFIGVYDEIFLNTKSSFYDRNRLYGAIGYQLNKTTGFQMGVLYQQVSNFGKYHLQFAVTFNPDLRK